MPVMEETTCKCGRAYSHCHNANCGGHNLYPLKVRSLSKSVSIGRSITVYRCKKCGNETDEMMECQAPSASFTTDFKPYQKPVSASPWGNLIPGSIEYGQAMNEWVAEYSHKKSINVNKAFCEAKRQGWQPELYDMEADLREELELAGLIPATKKYDRLLEQDQVGPTESAVSLDDIIKNLQEDSK